MQLAAVPVEVATLLRAIEQAQEQLGAAEPALLEQLVAVEQPAIAAALAQAGRGPLGVRAILQVQRALLGQEATPVPVDGHAGMLLNELVARYELAVSQRRLPPLLLLCALTLDVRVIQPFGEQDDALVRLLIVRELARHGYGVARHWSVERALLGGWAAGADAAQASQEGWTTSAHSVWPWAAWVLGVVAASYAELTQQIAAAAVRP